MADIQGCHIFLCTKIQKGGKYTKISTKYQMTMYTERPKICQMAVKNNKIVHPKAFKSCVFWKTNKPSGSPADISSGGTKETTLCIHFLSPSFLEKSDRNSQRFIQQQSSISCSCSMPRKDESDVS
jgi:hypothetical protein